ncbi:hypothetical protein FVER53590_10737 [Fusarium verticillioides]|nr:hypothetical protein FVER53590_10737 [Fusarium verticillioides]
MAMSKAVSEQELEAKGRQEAQERHRRKLEAAKFLIKLEWPLDSIEAVAQAAGIPSPDEGAISGPYYFLEINAINKATIEAYLKTNPSLTGFSPTFSHGTQQERAFHLPHCIRHWVSNQRYLITD